MRATLLGAVGAFALIGGAAIAWQALGAAGLTLGALAVVGAGLLAQRRARIIEAISQTSMPLASLTPRPGRSRLLFGASLAVGAWLAATLFTLVSLPQDALPPSGERVAELETNVEGLVVAVGLLGGGEGDRFDEGPPLTPAFPIAGPDSGASSSETPEAIPTFLPTLEPSAAATEAALASTPSTAIDLGATPSAGPASTPDAGATPSPLSQPRVTSGPGGGPLDTAGANLYNCADFETWEQAVGVFRASGDSDPNQLDTDGNGIPCEDLKAAELSR